MIGFFDNAIVASYVQTLIIFITGFFAFLIYRLNKNGEINSAARIVFIELKDAENVLNMIKFSGIATEETVVLSTKSWNEYRHLFIKRLTAEDFSLIEQFYTICEQTQKILEEIKSFKNDCYKERSLENIKTLNHFAEIDSINATSFYLDRKSNYLNIVHNEDYWYIPNYTKEKLSKYMQSFTPITGTTAFSLIRKISKMN